MKNNKLIFFIVSLIFLSALYFLPKKEISTYFNDTEIDRAVLLYLQGRMNQTGPASSHDYLAKHSIDMIDSITAVYQKTSPQTYAQEHKAMMEVIFEILQNVKNTKEAAEHARSFLAKVIESGSDPHDVQLYAMRHYLLYEYDENQRQRMVKLVLERKRNREVEEELKSLLEDYHPKRSWVYRQSEAEKRP